jgi:hypothetical protein
MAAFVSVADCGALVRSVYTRGPMAALVLACGVSFAGCGGGDQATAGPVDAGTPLGDGMVVEVSGSVEKQSDGEEATTGSVLVDVFHTDRAINQKVQVKIYASAGGSAVVAGAGNEDFEVPPGEYRAELKYSESDLAGGYKGSISGLVVTAGHLSRYQAKVRAPVGMLRMAFLQPDGPQRPPLKINDQVTVAVFKGDEDPDLSGALWTGPAGEWAALPEGNYQVRATFEAPGQPATVEWYRDLLVEGGLGRNDQEIHLEFDDSGVRIDAFNFGRDVNDRTTIYFFSPGANVNQAVAKESGPAGQVTRVDPGLYDIWVVYQPSTENPELLGTMLVPGFEVPERGGVRKQIDVEEPLASVRLKVMNGADDLSDSTELRVLRAGADQEAASPMVDEVGVSEHPVPVGTYDIYISVDLGAGPKKLSFRDVELGNGFVWEQVFDLKKAANPAAEVRRPAEPLRSLHWVEPAKGDDDDSGTGDDDDSASADQAPAEGDAAPAEGGDAPDAGAAPSDGAAPAATPPVGG